MAPRRLTIVIELPDPTRGGPASDARAEDVGEEIIADAYVNGRFVSAQWGDNLPEQDDLGDRLMAPDVGEPIARQRWHGDGYEIERSGRDRPSDGRAMTDRGAPPPEDPGRSPMCAWGILCADMPELPGHDVGCDDSVFYLARRSAHAFGYWLCRFHAAVARDNGLSITLGTLSDVQFVGREPVSGEVPPHRWDGLGVGGLPMACQFPGCTAPPDDRIHLRLSNRSGPRVTVMPPVFTPEDRPRGLVAPVVAYSILGAAVGLAVVGEAHRAIQAVLARRRLVRALRDAGVIE